MRHERAAVVRRVVAELTGRGLSTKQIAPLAGVTASHVANVQIELGLREKRRWRRCGTVKLDELVARALYRHASARGVDVPTLAAALLREIAADGGALVDAVLDDGAGRKEAA